MTKFHSNLVANPTHEEDTVKLLLQVIDIIKGSDHTLAQALGIAIRLSTDIGATTIMNHQQKLGIHFFSNTSDHFYHDKVRLYIKTYYLDPKAPPDTQRYLCANLDLFKRLVKAELKRELKLKMINKL